MHLSRGCGCLRISIHALREEGDPTAPSSITVPSISIHALREEGDGGDLVDGHVLTISIHALREEGDRSCSRRVLYWWNFYPRPPRGGRRWPS